MFGYINCIICYLKKKNVFKNCYKGNNVKILCSGF